MIIGSRTHHSIARRRVWGAAVLLILTMPAGAQPPQEQQQVQARLSKAYAAIDQAVAASRAPGMVVGITDRRELQKVIVHGYSDLKSRVPLKPDSRFAIGSVSKSFTAIALMQLFDEGRFDPDAPITRYLPWFKVNSKFAPIEGRHLLSHTAGLPNYLADLSSSRYAAYELRDFDTSYAPGTHFWYSNTGFQILGYALESIEHAPYHTIIERRILKPLGMTDTVAVIDDSQRANMAVSYQRWPYNDAYVEAPWFEYAASDGSIVSTAADMCAYARFILHRGASNHGKLLSDKSFQLLTTPGLDDYGFGLMDSPNGRRYRDQPFRRHCRIQQLRGSPHERRIRPRLLGQRRLGPGLRSMDQRYHQGRLSRYALARQPARHRPANAPTAQYANTYLAADGQKLELISTGTGLALRRTDATVPLLPMGRDTFRTPTDDPNSFPFIFGRAEARPDAKVVEVSHGAEWYASGGYAGAAKAATPPEYLAYVGHYENHNPEGPSVRIYVRNGTSWPCWEGRFPQPAITHSSLWARAPSARPNPATTRNVIASTPSSKVMRFGWSSPARRSIAWIRSRSRAAASPRIRPGDIPPLDRVDAEAAHANHAQLFR